MIIRSFAAHIPLNPHPRPFSRREKGGNCLLSPFGREVGSEGAEVAGVREKTLSNSRLYPVLR